MHHPVEKFRKDSKSRCFKQNVILGIWELQAKSFIQQIPRAFFINLVYQVMARLRNYI